MQVWNVLHTAHLKYKMQKWCKKSPSGHHRTNLSGWNFETKERIDNRKKNLLNSNISSTCIHNMANFGPLAAKICWRVWCTPANFNGFSHLGFVTATTSFTRGQPNFARRLAVSWAGTLYTFRGLLPCNGILEGAKFTLRSLHSAILAALLYGPRAVGIGQTLRRGTRNGITAPIFG